MSNTIAVVGTGYVGLTTGTCLAHLGHQVVCVDVDEAKVEMLRRGEIPIFEAGLAALVKEGQDAGRLRFTTDAVEAVTDAEFVFLCVPTPQGGDGAADLSYVQQAAATIGPHLATGAIVVNKSTVPVGSAGIVGEVIGRGDIAVVSNPEFLREGTAVNDFLKPDRVVVGCDDQSAAVRLAEAYAGLGAPVLVTDAASAEMIKYASNAFLATKISYVNAIAAVCEAVGADVNDVTLGMGYDKRIGAEFLRPGPGWGGSCFPKDSQALVNIAHEAGYAFDLLKSVIDTNEGQFDRVAGKVAELAGGDLEGRTVAVWGLTFKALTDDLRDSPALRISERLLARGARVQAYDPTVSTPPIEGIELAADAYAACEGADVLALLTEWDEFRWVDFDKVGSLLGTKGIVDARNLLDREALRRKGFIVLGIGRV
jgi:UDPglucose 6-dehydrogenase